MMTKDIPVLGFAAWSGTGKTTLLKQLLPSLKKRGLRVGCIKHAHHQFDVDTPGKDSYELRHAGASQMLIASEKRWALMVEKPQTEIPSLENLLGHLDTGQLDLILVEGFKSEVFPKIELFRPKLGKPLQYMDDASIIAIATDQPTGLPDDVQIPVLDINDINAIESFVCHYTQVRESQG